MRPPQRACRARPGQRSGGCVRPAFAAYHPLPPASRRHRHRAGRRRYPPLPPPRGAAAAPPAPRRGTRWRKAIAPRWRAARRRCRPRPRRRPPLRRPLGWSRAADAPGRAAAAAPGVLSSEHNAHAKMVAPGTLSTARASTATASSV
eukprot:scaffold40902_cov68-Phaeocystis_antarctica.AAC.2